MRALVATNRDGLKLARIGLSRACRVPLNYNPYEVGFEGLPLLKRLAQAFAAEGSLAELEHRTNDAATSYLDAIRLGHQAFRGGLIIHSLVGVADQSIGLTRLEPLTRTLDAQQCRKLATELETIEAQRESFATVSANESQWVRRTFGLKGKFALLVSFKSQRQMKQRFESKLQAQQVRTERLLVTLAARAYELDKGARPKALAELVPSYLKTIPQDPVTGTNLTYWP